MTFLPSTEAVAEDEKPFASAAVLPEAEERVTTASFWLFEVIVVVESEVEVVVFEALISPKYSRAFCAFVSVLS